MKISKVIGYGLSSPTKSDFVYYGYQNTIKNIGIVEVHTECGYVGYGETYAGVYCAELIEPCIKYLEQFFIGRELFEVDIDNLPFIGRSGLLKCIYSGIDVAMHDIELKSKNQLFQLSNKVTKTYASNGSGLFSPEQIEKDVKDIVELGYDAYKMRIGVQSKEIDLKRLEAARKHLGDRELMVDAIMGTNPNKWSLLEAHKWSRDLEQFNVSWLEEPFKPTDISKYTTLNQSSNIPIAGGEALNTFDEFCAYKDEKAVNIIQPDVTNCGGIKECEKLSKIFPPETIAMHVWGSRLALNANAHFAYKHDVAYLEVPMMELEINDYTLSSLGFGVEIPPKIKYKYKLQPQVNFTIL